MSKEGARIFPALKHGGYSAITLLPGEDRAAFERLHHALTAELEPKGSLEEDAVASIARLVWRKQNLATYRVAEQARKRVAAIQAETIPIAHSTYEVLPLSDAQDPEAIRVAGRVAREQAEKELGAALELVEIGDVVTTDFLLAELSIIQRMDSMIDRCLKRLLFIRGLKSLPSRTDVPSPRLGDS